MQAIIEFIIRRLKKSSKYYLKSHFTHYNMLARQASIMEEIIDPLIIHKDVISDPDYNNANSVSLLTAHSSKGLEFKVVILIDADSSKFPYKHSKFYHDDPNDELKLLYVAITRCSESLILTSVNNEKTKYKPTEFISKLKDIKSIIDCAMIKSAL